MKRCPHCRASIEEHARFCLYCMTPLEKKTVIASPKPRRRHTPLWIITGCLVIVTGTVLAVWQPWNAQPIQTHSPADTTPADTAVVAGTTTAAAEEPAADTTSADTAGVAGTTTAAAEEPAPNTTVLPSYEAVMSVGDPQYLYRTAERYRDYMASANVAEDALAITGIAKPSEDGIYVIPETIDGHPVYKVDALAFSDEAVRDTVKTVVFSSSVRRVDDDAFAACYNLTDVYYCGNNIFVDAFAYPDPADLQGVLTIHCAADCHDNRFHFHKNQTVYAYEEWNGGELS